LQFDLFSTGLDNFGAKLNTNGGIMIEFEFFLEELEQNAGFSYTWVEIRIHVSPITMNLKR
jgi:hypothetical protein